MDPLSATLAAITLATAVKDMVELGQKIHESFANVSRNLRNTQRIAQNIKEMVEEIDVFCENHKDELDDMKDFGAALRGLLGKLRNFENSILPLLPKPGQSRFGLFIRGWLNNNKIRDSLANLEGDIVLVMRRHMMASTMRIEIRQKMHHQETTRHLTGITQDIRDFRTLRTTATASLTHSSDQSSGTTSDEFNRNVIMFAQSSSSSSAPMLRTPNVITEELLTAAFIKLQINSIATRVEKMSMIPASAQNTITKFAWAPFIRVKLQSLGILNLRLHVVRTVATMRDLLETGHLQSISTSGIIGLNNVAAALGALGMRHEAALLDDWTVMLARTLADASGNKHPDLNAHLAFYLINQSNNYFNGGDRIQALQAVNEAYTITQDLRNQHGGRTAFQILHSTVLLKYAELVDNQLEQSMKMCVDAIGILEDILHVRAFTQTDSRHRFEKVIQHCSSDFLNTLFSPAAPITAVVEYANALKLLATFLRMEGHPETALALWLLVIEMHRKLVSICGDEWKTELVQALLSLIDDDTASCMPIEGVLDITEECLQLLRGLMGRNPQHYGRKLLSALCTKAITLEKLGRDAEAIAAWEEIASLTRQIVQDSALCTRVLGHLSDKFRQLKRRDDAVRTATLAMTTYHEEAGTRAVRYYNMSVDLRQLRRYKESAQAARKSVELHRNLAARDPKKWVCELAGALSNLTYCWVAIGDFAEAQRTWKESVDNLDWFLETHTEANTVILEVYCTSPSMHRKISLLLKDEGELECLKVGSTAVRHLRKLLNNYPQHHSMMRRLVWAEFTYAYNLLRVGRLQDAGQHIDDCLDAWSGRSEATSDSTIAQWCAMMANLKVDVFDAQGSTRQAVALLASQDMCDVMKLSSISTSSPFFGEMIKSLHRKSRLQVDLGESEEALRVSEAALRLCRESAQELLCNTLVWSLHGVAFTALSCCEFARAAEVAREGCDITSPDGPDWDQGEQEFNVFLRPSLIAFLSSAEANLGNSSIAIQHAHHAVDESLDIGEMKADVSATAAKQSYLETRGNLSEILLVTGDVLQVLQICEERKAYFSERVETRMGDYRELAPILRMLGILCCNQGRHEEGEAAAQELSRIMKTLGNAFPSLQEEIKIRLRHQARVPILKVLNDMTAKLDCEHQTEINSLFAT